MSWPIICVAAVQKCIAMSQNMPTLSWDDLRVFLACAEQSSFRKAAKLLKIDSATIVRRIERLEQVIGYRLFVRHKVESEGLR